MRQQGIYDKPQLRMMTEGMLHRLRVGCPWRDIPAIFGPWNSIYKKFNRWSKNDKWLHFFKALVQNPDLEWSFIDGSVVKAHQHSAGAATKQNEAIGKSVAGNSTKIHMAVEAQGLPIDFELTGGEVHDCKAAPDLLDKLPETDFTVADKGYDSDEVREKIREKNSVPVIPRKKNSKTGNRDIDWCLYKYRHLVENLFARLKHFRSIATRFDKLKRNYAATLLLACAYLWLPM